MNRGSALVATILIVGAIGVILAGVGRVTLLELRSTTTLEDSTLAFSTAEAGIEEGLLRWRFNRNVELPVLSGAEMTETIRQAVRVNLTSGQVQSQAELGKNLAQAPTDATYDLRIWYKVPAIGSPDPAVLNGTDSSNRLFKDQALELDVTNLAGQPLSLIYQIPQALGDKLARVEIRFAKVSADGSTVERCDLPILSCKQITDLSQEGTRLTLGPVPSVGVGESVKLRLRSFIFEADGTTPAPASTFINYFLAPVAPTKLIDSGTTFIEATGYFGTSQRKLLAKVNRATGTILGVFDFALFSNQDIQR